MKKIIISILLSCSILISSLISEIRIAGNFITKNDVILREIQHPLNIKYSDSIRVEDQNRLYNLGIFSFVEIKQHNDIYQINVNEIFRYYPLPLFDIDESKGKEGTSYGFALNMLNLFGRNQRLEIGGMYGNKNIYFIRFHDPWIFGDHISFNLDLYQFLSNSFWYDNKIENEFSNSKQGFEIGSGFNYLQKNKLKFNASLIKNKLEFHNEIDLDDNFKSYQNLGFEVDYAYDSRNIYNDPTIGKLFKINFNYFHGIENTHSYSNYFLEYNQFNQISSFRELTLINRTKCLIQNENHIPIFNYESLGSEDFVRGYNPYPNQNDETFRKRIRFSQIISHSIEIQYTLVEKKSYGGMELGLDNLFFFDIGIGGETLSDFKSNKPLIGFGLGFRYFASGFGTIGIDFGFNPKFSSPQIHLSDGQDN